MKTLLTRLMVLGGVMLFVLSACKKNDTLTVLSKNPKGGTLTVNSSTFVLDKTQASSTDSIVTFTFTQPDFGYKAAVTNTLEFDLDGDNWANPDTVVLSAGILAKKYTSDDFNNIMLKLHITTDVATKVNVRVKQSVANNIAPAYTAAISMTITAYSNAQYLWVPGAYQGWLPSSAPSLVAPKGDGNYSGIINFNSTDLEFKLTPAQTWDNSYGSNDNKTIIYNGGGNILAPVEGGFLVSVSTNANTISFDPQWSVIGDASPGGWSTDTDMYYDATTGNWYITCVLVSDGTQAIKFRFENQWTVNLGGSGGTLTSGGDNIAIPKTAAGGDTYKITMNPTANTYTLVKQ